MIFTRNVRPFHLLSWTCYYEQCLWTAEYPHKSSSVGEYCSYMWLASVSQQLCNGSQDLSRTAEEAGGERGEGGGSAAAGEDGAATAECVGGVSSGSTGVLSVASSSQEQLLDEHLEECPLCLLSQPRCHFPRLASCSHRTCSDCLRQYLRIEISESRVCIACPQCPETLAPLDVRAILDDRALLERFEEYQLRRFLAADLDTRWCPAPDCRWESEPQSWIESSTRKSQSQILTKKIFLGNKDNYLTTLREDNLMTVE